MNVNIEHETSYTYEEEVHYSIQRFCLTPPSFVGQHVHTWKLSTFPPAELHELEDGFGNLVHQMVLAKPHRSLTIRVVGMIDTEDTNAVTQGLSEKFPPHFYLRETDQSRCDKAIQELAERARTAGPDTIAILHELMSLIRDTVDYRTGETQVSTTAAEAIGHGYGVCQDHAHIFLAAARYLDIPARYVSGYLVGGEDESAAEASHAWAEAYVENLGWLGFDVANRICPTDHYVRVASGLDYQSVAPIRGIRRGGGTGQLAVAVNARPQEIQSAQQ